MQLKVISQLNVEEGQCKQLYITELLLLLQTLSTKKHFLIGPSGVRAPAPKWPLNQALWNITPMNFSPAICSISKKELSQDFQILHGLPSNTNNRIPMKKKKSGTPPSPLKKPIWAGQKLKWAVSPRRVCATVLKFCRGS